MDPPLSRTMEQLADELGASDIFVFRRVTSSRFVHVGGAGRGKTWTAPLEVDVEIDLFGVRLRVGQPLWMRYREPQRIFGPYHAASAVAVQLNQDALVVFGATTAQPSGSGPTTATLIEAAERAVEWSENLSPPGIWPRSWRSSTRVRHWQIAVGPTAQSRMRCPTWRRSPRQRSAARWPLSDGRYHVHESGWTLPDRGAAVRTVLRGLWDARAELPRCVQDAKQVPLAFPLDHASGVRPYYVLPFDAPASALLLVAHTKVAPRGFTSLCQALGTELMLTAKTVLARAVLREQLLQALAEESDAREALTDLPNRVLLERHAEGLGRGPLWVSRTEPPAAERNLALLYIDLDHFKSINDDFGHTIGDRGARRVLPTVARVLPPQRRACAARPHEFALLIVEPLTAEQALAGADRVVRAAAVP